jgi:polyisoprenoid-binding protein YceI
MKIPTSKFLYFILLVSFYINPLQAQKFMTKTGHAYFMSHTDAIDIDGNNHQVAAIADRETGEVVVIVLIKAFEFTLATADKHFNETYMESDIYPKATFSGKVLSLKEIDISKNGDYTATAEGTLTIHGQTKPIKQTGILTVNNGKISINCNFSVLIDDYKIEVPKSVEGRVAQKVDIKIDLTLLPK